MANEWDERYDLHLRTTVQWFETERVLMKTREAQEMMDKDQLVSWLLWMGPWDVIAHFTWRDRIVRNKDGSPKALGVSEHAAARGVERYMRQLPGVSYFYAVERNPSRDGHHVHALWGDCQRVYRKEAWARWFKEHGRARIEPVRADKDVANYASKYVMKSPAWWNLYLQWHRQQRCAADSVEVREVSGSGSQLKCIEEQQTTSSNMCSQCVSSPCYWVSDGKGVWHNLS